VPGRANYLVRMADTVSKRSRTYEQIRKQLGLLSVVMLLLSVAALL